MLSLSHFVGPEGLPTIARLGFVFRRAVEIIVDEIPAQEALREAADTLETLVADDLWPLPKYRELLFQH